MRGRGASFAWHVVAVFAFLAASIGNSAADELSFPATVVPRERAAPIIDRLDAPASGQGVLHIDWSDDAGHLLDRRDIPVTLDRQSEISFAIDTRRALAMSNRLSARVSVGGQTRAADARFVVAPVPADWSDYQIIMWQPQTAQSYRLLQTMGVDNAMMIAERATPRVLDPKALDPLIAASMRWYDENAATDFYSAYHRWFPDRPVNWRFLAAERLYREHPKSLAAFIRSPSLSDPAWLKKIAVRLRATVETNAPYHPLFYTLADESGIADLNAFWDFDFSRYSLAAMRQWLKTRYSSLAALNAEWNSHFASWDAVMPMTTAAAMKRGDGDYAGWEDFHAWMDVAFARALAAGVADVHSADPTALAGIEGGQKLGWGGYNYATLAGAVDVMETEPRLFPLVHDLDPHLRLILTSHPDPAERHEIWQTLLDGGRGMIIWDSKQQFITADGTLGPRGASDAPDIAQISSGIGALVVNLHQVADSVAILYSPTSLEIQWLLDWRGKGDAWTQRGADAEDSDDGTVRMAMNAFAESVTKLGFVPRYLSSGMVAHGALGQGCRVLILPHTVALSRAEAKAIEEFAARGGTVIADVAPGTYDAHGRKLAGPRLTSFERAAPGDAKLGDLLAHAGLKPSFAVSGASAVQRVFDDGKVALLTLQQDDETAVAGTATVTLPHAAFVYDLRAKSFLGERNSLTVPLDGATPALFALSPTALPAPEISAPEIVHPGEWVRLHLGAVGPSPAALDVFHLALSEPSGKAALDYRINVVTREAGVERDIFLPENAPLGAWTITVGDVLSGQTVERRLTVAAK